MDENQIYYLGRVEKNTIVLKQNSNRLREYNWRAYDDIISAMNAEKEAIMIQGSSVFAATTNGGHPYMIILSVPESRDAIGVYVDYFKPTVTAFRYKNDSFEIII